jgi:hypothetical protein
MNNFYCDVLHKMQADKHPPALPLLLAFRQHVYRLLLSPARV